MKYSKEYRFLIGAMAKVRWVVENGRQHRPDGAHDVYTLMARLRDYCLSDPNIDYETQLTTVSHFVNLSNEQLLYLADVGEWLELDRSTEDLSEEEYDEFWSVPDNLPSMNVYYHFMPQSPHKKDKKEIDSLNALYYGSV